MSPRLLVLLAAVCFGTTGTAQALGPDDARAAAVGAGRVALGGALLVLFALATQRREDGPRRGRTARGPVGPVPAAGGGDTAHPPRPATEADDTARASRLPRGLLVLAGACVAAYQLCFFAAVDDTGVAVGTVVAIGSGPAFAGALGWLVAGDAPGRRWAMATALACGGVALLVLGGGSADVSTAGVLLALGAGGGYAAYTVIAKQLLRRGHTPERVMAGAFGTGGALLTPVLVLTAGPWLGTAGGLAMIAFLGVVPTALAYVMFARGLRQLSAAETATFTLAEPLTAALLGAVVLGERPGLVAICGGGLVLCGLLALASPWRAGSRAAAGEAAVPAHAPVTLMGPQG